MIRYLTLALALISRDGTLDAEKSFAAIDHHERPEPSRRRRGMRVE
jgi:hypothetical protein